MVHVISPISPVKRGPIGGRPASLPRPPGRRSRPREVAGELREAVRSGRLPAGTRLPAVAVTSPAISPSRAGWSWRRTSSSSPRGSWSPGSGPGRPWPPSRWRSPRRRPTPPATSAGGRPRPTSAPFPRQAWSAAYRHVLATLPHDALDYGDPGGVPELGSELAAYLKRVRAARAEPENVVVVTGVAQGVVAGRPGAGAVAAGHRAADERAADAAPAAGPGPSWSGSRWTTRGSTSPSWPAAGPRGCCSPRRTTIRPGWCCRRAAGPS